MIYMILNNTDLGQEACDIFANLGKYVVKD